MKHASLTQGLSGMIVGIVSSHSLIFRLLAQAIPLHWLLLYVLLLIALLSRGMTDSDSKQDVLRSAWLDARDGSLLQHHCVMFPVH